MIKYMKPRLALSAALACAVPLLAFAQKRVSKEEPADFGAIVEEIARRWEAESYGKCLEALGRATRLAGEKRSEQLVAALPDAPEGFVKKPLEKREQLSGNAFGAALMGSVGNITTQRYDASTGRGGIDVTLTTDSPMVSMMSMVFGNPAMLEKGTEVIEYPPHKALLKTAGERRELQIVLENKHLCDVTANGLSEETLFKMFDQAAVDRLVEVLKQ